MIAKTWLTLAALTAGILAAGVQESVEEREPPMIFSLEVEGKRVPVELDKAFELETKNPTTKVTLRAAPHRIFNFGGVRFHYPREMGFEADLGTPGVKIWTLDGNNAVFIMQLHSDAEDHQALRKEVIDAMVQQYGRGNVKREPSSLVVQKKRLSGTTLQITLSGIRLSQAVYSFQAGKDAVVFVLQDSLTDDEELTDEFTRTLKLFKETFQFPKDSK